MVNLTSRLDIHEQQINQLQADITEIKASLLVLTADRAESVAFRKAVMSWMQSQEQNLVDDSSASGSDSTSGNTAPPILISAFSAHTDLSVFLPDPASGPKIDHPVNRFSDSLTGIISHQEATSVGLGDNLRKAAKQSTDHAKLELIGDNWAISDYLRWTLGSDTKMGHVVEQQFVVGQFSPALGLTCSILDLCGLSNVPFDKGKDALYHIHLNGTKLTFSITWQFWLVHGQPRPPEDTFGVRARF